MSAAAVNGPAGTWLFLLDAQGRPITDEPVAFVPLDPGEPISAQLEAVRGTPVPYGGHRNCADAQTAARELLGHLRTEADS
ncbi:MULTISPECIES: hypothetical protein [unclassified Streptomyces]|uniref:hypothetical protein n=1 Tax=unclassified Streptomyces TaxID=2593676 RepID=UPI0005F9830F|nr:MULTISPECIES: hypothetical protein [unclassified Streptomyces]KJY32941.1 hypothetical protein VR45_21075 [Streptomyces sp. NRRL S-495]KOV30478.1 hypothetical protein ADK60_16575 [Streptomyces sp. XY431]